MATATTISKLLKNAKLGQAGLALTAAQVGKDELSWFLESFQYSFNSDYTFDFDADMVFIDKKGVASTALEY